MRPLAPKSEADVGLPSGELALAVSAEGGLRAWGQMPKILTASPRPRINASQSATSPIITAVSGSS